MAAGLQYFESFGCFMSIHMANVCLAQNVDIEWAGKQQWRRERMRGSEFWGNIQMKLEWESWTTVFVYLFFFFGYCIHLYCLSTLEYLNLCTVYFRFRMTQIQPDIGTHTHTQRESDSDSKSQTAGGNKKASKVVCLLASLIASSPDPNFWVNKHFVHFSIFFFSFFFSLFFYFCSVIATSTPFLKSEEAYL